MAPIARSAEGQLKLSKTRARASIERQVLTLLKRA
jgi:hypothetical protein